MNNDGEPFAHAVDNGEFIPATQGNGKHGIVGEGWAYDGDAESLLCGLPQAHFTGNLIARIFPVGVFQRSRFGDHSALRWLLISGGGTDEYVLCRALGKKTNIPFYMVRCKGDPLHNGVELLRT